MRSMHVKSLVSLAIVAIFAVGATACSGSKQQQVPQDQTSQETTDKTQSKTVILYQYRFNPSQLTVVKGTEVTFENKDPDKHNVSIPALNVSEDLENGDEFTHTFDTLGEFAVSDRFSATGMKMSIKVIKEGEEMPSSDDSSTGSEGKAAASGEDG